MSQSWWDTTALETLTSELAGQPLTLKAASKLSGGAIQENWLITLHTADGQPREFVLRSDAATSVAASRSRAEEFALLSAAWGAGLTVPQPLARGDHLGRPCFLMARAYGISAGHRLAKDDALVPDRPALARQIGREMAKLHQIRPGHAGLDFLTQDARPASLQALDDIRAFLDAHPQPRPILAWAEHWLRQRQPVPVPAVLTHRDLRTGNYMVHEGQLTAILDWEFAQWSDPAEDIGWFCASCWRFGNQTQEAGGIGPRDALLAGYAEVAGQAPSTEAIHFWEILAHLRWAVIALQQAERVANGERSLELALTGYLVPDLEKTLLALTGIAAARVPAASAQADSRQRPAEADLLLLAHDALKAQLLPQVASQDQYTARMIMNALRIAARKLQAPAAPAEALMHDLGQWLTLQKLQPADTLEARERQLITRLRQDALDLDGQQLLARLATLI